MRFIGFPRPVTLSPLAPPPFGAIPLVALLLGLASVGPAAAQAASVESLFPQRAAIVAGEAGLVRLDLPIEVVAGCQADLSDLRLVDASGRELPFALDRVLPDPGVERELVRSAAAPLIAVDRTREDRLDGPPRYRETLTVAMPDAQPIGGRWNLVVSTELDRFVRQVRVEALDPQGTASPLVEGAPLFRLAEPSRQQLRLPLPPVAAERLRLVIEGEADGFLEPFVRLESAELLPEAPMAEVALEILSQEWQRERTTLELARPRGLVPARVRLVVADAAFRRRVTLLDAGRSSTGSDVERPLAAGDLFRLPVPANRADPGLEELELALPPGVLEGDRLRLVIEDDGSPTLAGLAVVALVRRPTLLFVRPAEGAALLFGGGRALRPRYGLTEMLGDGTGSASAWAVALLEQAESLPRAELGPIEPNPRFDPAPALTFAQRAGTAIEPRGWSHQRTLDLVPSADGLSRLRLTAEDLAVTAADLADPRIVDEEDRQWAWVTQPATRAAAPEVDLEASPPKTENRASRYRLRPAVTPIAADRLTVRIDEPFFDRAFRVEADSGDGTPLELAAGRLVRPIGSADDGETAVHLALPGSSVEGLALVIEDGDDAPLTLRAASARVQTADLAFAAPAGRYRLLLGNPDAEAPRYELARFRELILTLGGAETVPGALVANPSHRGAALLRSADRRRILLWLVLGGTLIALLALTFRLVRRDQAA